MTDPSISKQTLDDRFEKENAFRISILKKFEMKPVINDHNNGLRAIVSALNRDIDANSEEMTAVILRGDIVEHVMKHPENYRAFLQNNENLENDLEEWQTKMLNSERVIGALEIMAMSYMLEMPIQVFSFENRMDDQVLPMPIHTFGTQFTEAPISLYFDPIRFYFMPIYIPK